MVASGRNHEGERQKQRETVREKPGRQGEMEKQRGSAQTQRKRNREKGRCSLGERRGEEDSH